MREFLGAVLVLCVSGGAALAQYPGFYGFHDPQEGFVGYPLPLYGYPTPTRHLPCFWMNAEYLRWWVKEAPSTFPLVTTGNPADPNAGALGQPGTVPLFGGNDIDFGDFNGGRVTLGWWWHEGCLGIEASGFALEQKENKFSRASNPAGNPPLYVPLFRTDLGREERFVISDPVLGTAGNVQLDSALLMWGAEGNLIFSKCQQPCHHWEFLLGVRYVDLKENLFLTANVQNTAQNVQISINEGFETRNQFYGGQVGLRWGWTHGKWSLDLVGKAALGVTHQVVQVTGSTQQTSGTTTNTFAGGIFTAPSNLGRDTRNAFTVIPQAQVKLAYEFFPGWKAFIGYDFIYWNEVVRPADQMDRSVNATQLLGGQLVGDPQPARRFTTNDFWAHGASAGLEFRY